MIQNELRKLECKSTFEVGITIVDAVTTHFMPHTKTHYTQPFVSMPAILQITHLFAIITITFCVD
jgi:hypothetical protein